MTPATTHEQPQTKRPFRLPAAIWWLREIAAIAVWGAAATQLLIFDLAGYIAKRVPVLTLPVRFRLLVVLGVLSILWLILRGQRFTLIVGYVLAYPFVLLFWRLPRLLFRNWPVVVAFSPAIHSLLHTFKSSFVLSSAALIAAFLICLASSRLVIGLCMAFLAFYLSRHFFRRFRIAFSPSTVFADFSSAIRTTWEQIRHSALAQPADGAEPGTEDYKQKFGQNVLLTYVVSTTLYVLGVRLRSVVASRKLDLYFLASLLYTFLLTAFVFGLEYTGLERVMPGSFTGVQQPSVLDFLGLSFSTLMTSDVSPLRASTKLAQAGLYVQLFGSLLIVVLLAFVILTSIRERYRQDLDEVVTELGTVSETVGRFLEKNFDLTVAAAEAFLLDSSPVVTRWLLSLRYGDERAREMYAAATARGGPVAPKPPEDLPVEPPRLPEPPGGGDAST